MTEPYASITNPETGDTLTYSGRFKLPSKGEPIMAIEVATAQNFPKRTDFPPDDNEGYMQYHNAVKEWGQTHAHYAADGTTRIEVGVKLWDNNLRVVEITEVATDSRPYSDTGEISTWHGSTGDTLTGYMGQYGRLTGRYGGLDAKDYPVGTNYSDVK